MFGNKKKTIGVFIFALANHFQKKLCTSIMKAGTENDFNVAVFSCFGNQINSILQGERKILQLPPFEDLDGVILALDTIESLEVREELVAKVKERCTCPVISIRQKVEGFHNILVDDNSSMEEMIRHFVEGHKFRDICFLAGPKGNQDSDKRLACFRKVMQENNKRVKEDQIYYGDFWKYCAKDACGQFIDERGRLPDAIICANDYMAVSVCNELLARNIEVPGDVAVCGYDNIWETTVCAPSISTVMVPFEEMGAKAVHMIKEALDGKELEENVYMPVKAVKRESCGCVRPEKEELMKDRKDFYERYERQRDKHFRAAYLSIALEEIETVPELYGALINYMDILENMKRVHICLDRRVEHFFTISKEGLSDEVYRCLSLHGRGVGIEGDNNEIFKFPTSELLPHNILDEGPQGYTFMPLHYKEHLFGYTAVCFWDDGCCDELYRTWMNNLSNALQDMMVRRQMDELYKSLANSYVRDALTGLYNRRGFNQGLMELAEKAIEEKKELFILAADLDKLKHVNDTKGHAEGDKLLIAMANALLEVADEGTICARMGGDEYSVAGICTGEEEVKAYMNKLRESLKKFGVSASCGVAITELETNKNLEYYMNLSDRYMYQDKQARRIGGSYA